jgi:hypothetical protein
MRFTLLILLLLFASALTACSFSTEFVVVNDSGSPVLLRYKLRDARSDPPAGSEIPATLAAQQIRSGEWGRLSAGQYEFDPGGGEVAVSLKPDEALRISVGRNGEKGECVGIDGSIREVAIQGAAGEVTLKGDQVYKSFGVEPKPSYSLSKNTICTLRYK